MAEYEQLRDELDAARRVLEERRQEALLAREAAGRAERALEAFARSETPQGGEERERLEAALASARERARRLDAELERLRREESRLVGEFEEFTDPRRQLGRLPDVHPILLFPLRLETRFKRNAAGLPQLWVRVYPDTCLIDSFEESLTEQEVATAREFWAAVWRAGGDEAAEREAWRELVASHSSGRAGWVVRRYTPLNPNDKPAKDNESDVLLIIVAPGPLPAAAGDFWRSAWKAAGDAAAEQAAFAALEAAVGPQQARELADKFRPFNFDDAPAPPRTRADVQVKVAVLQLNPTQEVQTRRTSWSSAPRAELLPERFVLVATSRAGARRTELGRTIRVPLAAGPDPYAPPAQQLRPDGDTLRIPDELGWMFDFELALEQGMAFRIDLTAEEARVGFERLVVVGVRLGDTPGQGARHLARLLEHHLYSGPGLEIVPQGTPTNNTEQGGSGYSFRDDSDATFETFFRQTPLYANESDPLLRRDGQWLADLLGLPHELARRIPNAGGRDQSEARAMQIALWPGTLGYMMETQLAPVFSVTDVAATRFFFTRQVSGRGPLPALRIGPQPYGILPTTAFDRVNWFQPDGGVTVQPQSLFLLRLYRILQRIEDDWRPLAERVSFVGKRGQDPHQLLLDVLGLHPSSVEYFPQQADGLEAKFYELTLLNFTLALEFIGQFPSILPLTLLRSMGYNLAEVPDLLNKVFRARQTPLTGPVVDDRPLSERDAIRGYAAGKNYIEWLIDAARTGFETLQQERGFDGDKKPTALLYLLLRHALQLSFHLTAVRLSEAAGVLDSAALAKRDPAFVHVAEQGAASESNYDLLFRADERVTQSADLLIGDFITRNVMAADPDLREQIEALERLKGIPTARLERIFAEHIDCCSYRLDAWKAGLLGMQLETLRRQAGEEPPGLFLGAFGWVERLRPENKVFTPVELPADLDAVVNTGEGESPLVRDSTNAGLVHAPSFNHATTAAVLRNGYLANEGRLAVDLSSRRVRLALGILEGMRNGQSFGALLGYQFERHVHDHGPLQVRELIYPLRRQFPLAANQIERTRTEEGEARESVTAVNVVDGRRMLEHAELRQDFVYPFGLTTLPRRAAPLEAAVTAALAHIRDINDALSDLALAESVHQAVLGNFDRSAATLEAFSKGDYPPEPEVILPPRTGVALTLRTAIHLSPGAPANPLTNVPLTRLAEAEPAANAWLAKRLPPQPALVGCNVSFTDGETDAERVIFVSQEELGLQPIDLVYLLEARAAEVAGDLDDRILRRVYANHTPRHDREIVIRHTERVEGRVTWFELQALLRSLRPLVVAARPLEPADLLLSDDADGVGQAVVSLERERVASPHAALLDPPLLPALDAAAAALADPNTPVDDALAQFAEAAGHLADYRLPQTGTAFVFQWRAGVYTALVEKLSARVRTWEERLARFEPLIDEDEALPAGTPDAERLPRLQEAEVIISTQLTLPPPADADDYRDDLEAKRQAFVGKLGDLRQLAEVPRATLAELLSDARAQLPLDEFDPEPLDFGQEDAEVTRFRAQAAEVAALLKADVLRRRERVNALLAEHDAAPAPDRVPLLQEAAKQLFGDDFQLVPQITLPAAAADELANAFRHSTSGDLTRHLIDGPPARDFPVDDWLHGAARVRENMRHWENVALLGDAFGAEQSPDLTPLQLPFQPGDPWLALELPPGHEITSERLLYTAHFAEPFDASQSVRGLLVDEWVEVIPGTDETTGIAFHYDRPNSEPPQVWLLALAAVRDGAWTFEELLDAVNDALDSAKLRALEPAHLGDTPYSWFLPATMSSYTFPEISISNNLLRNLRIYEAGFKE